MDIEIVGYENWMKDQIVQLFCTQYNSGEIAFRTFFEAFYEHPFQQEKAIMLVAKQGDKIAGFQSFFYWPYLYKEKKYNSFQSGNSLVSPQYRGQGIFGKLLDVAMEKAKASGVDFIMGFPVEESRNSFLKKGWKNILDLQWLLKINNPFSLLFHYSENKIEKYFSKKAKFNLVPLVREGFKLSGERDFLSWKRAFPANKNLYFFEYSDPENQLEFEIKFTKRKSIFLELTIGNINATSFETVFIEKAFNAFLKIVRKLPFVTFVSIAVNPTFKEIPLSLFQKKGFKVINKKIYFIIKNLQTDENVLIPEKWELYRGDIDTW